ncbi:MAG: protein-glutamate O-methyltransferase CheR [Planctomycetaceae bacterium]|nr:protein-glutamate O-methyltransferase CheR [Planctomycetaceae bacterium]
MSAAAPTLDPACFNFLSEFVRTKSAIVLEPNKAYLLESRLMPVARQNGLTSLPELVAQLQRPGSQALGRQVVDAMTTNETSFYRDIHPFDALKQHILPELLRNRHKERSLHIWSNACSSGQEVYSIAMLLREHFPELASWKVRLIASDLSSAILEKAKAGVFNQTEVNRGLPMQLLLKYFTRNGLQWQVNAEIRNSVEFMECNLIQNWPTQLPKMDIIFLRNVLIYFDPATKTTVLNKASSLLRPDGYLFLGGAESTMNLAVALDREVIGKATCYRPHK